MWRIILATTSLWCQTGAHEPTVDLNIGRRVFESQCALCHGQNGAGGRGPDLRRPKLKNAPTPEALRKVIFEGLGADMPGAWQLSVREVASVAGYVSSLGRMAVEFVPGNTIHGEELFRSRGCVNCHIVAGKGSSNGPELTNVGARRNAEFLRESLTKPAAFLPDGFLVVEATTAGGSVIRGVKLNEDNFSIQIGTADGKRHSLDKNTLKDLKRRTGQSTMPAFANLPANDIEDLVAYLASLKGAE